MSSGSASQPETGFSLPRLQGPLGFPISQGSRWFNTHTNMEGISHLLMLEPRDRQESRRRQQVALLYEKYMEFVVLPIFYWLISSFSQYSELVDWKFIFSLQLYRKKKPSICIEWAPPWRYWCLCCCHSAEPINIQICCCLSILLIHYRMDASVYGDHHQQCFTPTSTG